MGVLNVSRSLARLRYLSSHVKECATTPRYGKTGAAFRRNARPGYAARSLRWRRLPVLIFEKIGAIRIPASLRLRQRHCHERHWPTFRSIGAQVRLPLWIRCPSTRLRAACQICLSHASRFGTAIAAGTELRPQTPDCGRRPWLARPWRHFAACPDPSC